MTAPRHLVAWWIRLVARYDPELAAILTNIDRIRRGVTTPPDPEPESSACAQKPDPPKS